MNQRLPMIRVRPATPAGLTKVTVSGVSVRGVAYERVVEVKKLPMLRVKDAKTGLPVTKPNRKKTVVTVHGVTYSSLVEAAKALGVTPSAVSGALNKGTLELLGERRKAQVVHIAGTTFPSMRALARYLDLPFTGLYSRMTRTTKGRVHVENLVYYKMIATGHPPFPTSGEAK